MPDHVDQGFGWELIAGVLGGGWILEYTAKVIEGIPKTERLFVIALFPILAGFIMIAFAGAVGMLVDLRRRPGSDPQRAGPVAVMLGLFFPFVLLGAASVVGSPQFPLWLMGFVLDVLVLVGWSASIGLARMNR